MNNRKLTIMATALFLSLLGNMFFLGLWVGGINYQSTENSSEIIVDSEYQAAKIKDIDQKFRNTLPANDKKVLRQQMKKARSSIMHQKQAMIKAREAVRHAMNTESFNQNALNKALENEQQQRQKMHKIISHVRRSMASNMSPKGRKAFAAMQERLSQYNSEPHFRNQTQNNKRHKKRRDYRQKRQQH